MKDIWEFVGEKKHPQQNGPLAKKNDKTERARKKQERREEREIK